MHRMFLLNDHAIAAPTPVLIIAWHEASVHLELHPTPNSFLVMIGVDHRSEAAEMACVVHMLHCLLQGQQGMYIAVGHYV